MKLTGIAYLAVLVLALASPAVAEKQPGQAKSPAKSSTQKPTAEKSKAAAAKSEAKSDKAKPTAADKSEQAEKSQQPADTRAACEVDTKLATLVAPLHPSTETQLRVVIASNAAADGELKLIAPDGSTAVTSAERRGGPPYFWLAEVQKPIAGKWQAKLSRPKLSGDCTTITRDITVKEQPGAPPASNGKSVWPLRAAWTGETENLYSAWIEKLFDDPVDQSPSWPALHEVLRDPARNVLHNYLGAKEDERKLTIKPDCADLPYFLRAYFAFKMGLPYGYAKCSRGGGGRAPTCPVWVSMHAREEAQPVAQQKTLLQDFFGAAPQTKKPEQPKSQGLAQSFGRYITSDVANTVHSGSGRTALADDKTDYYPVPLSQEALRPGTVYADPYGHLLVLVKRVPQTATSAGVFLAVDGQPDGTISRKRFWRGNFLFADDKALGGPGFKRFRPIVRDKQRGFRRLANAEIAKNPNYADFSLDQSKLNVEAFYDQMDDVMSPSPLDPVAAMKDAITSLEEQVKGRVTSVENGRKYQIGGGGEAAMPDGAAIFETTGAWEDFATPSRDLRLLIAIDVVRGFPDRVARRPERYAMPSGKSPDDVKSELQSVLKTELESRSVAYTRTDGSSWSLKLQNVADRAQLLETAYNLNDCVELRWGAADGSDEAKTCKRRAPASQQKKMATYRKWFSERRRPPRT